MPDANSYYSVANQLAERKYQRFRGSYGSPRTVFDDECCGDL